MQLSARLTQVHDKQSLGTQDGRVNEQSDVTYKQLYHGLRGGVGSASGNNTGDFSVVQY